MNETLKVTTDQAIEALQMIEFFVSQINNGGAVELHLGPEVVEKMRGLIKEIRANK